MVEKQGGKSLEEGEGVGWKGAIVGRVPSLFLRPSTNSFEGKEEFKKVENKPVPWRVGSDASHKEVRAKICASDSSKSPISLFRYDGRSFICAESSLDCATSDGWTCSV
jgi:hypothetical protein